MEIPIKLQMLIDDIIEKDYTDDEWLELQKEVEAYQKELTEEEMLYFAESGAGEALYMACTGILSMRKSNGK